MNLSANNRTKSTRGGSLLEVVVVLAVLIALVRLAIPNFYNFKNRAYDASAFKTYKKVKEQLQVLDRNNSLDPSHSQDKKVAIFNQLGSSNTHKNSSMSGKVKLSSLPAINIPKGVIVHYAMFIPGDRILQQEDRLALEVSHSSGGTFYRYLKVGTNVLEQQIKKEYP